MRTESRSHLTRSTAKVMLAAGVFTLGAGGVAAAAFGSMPILSNHDAPRLDDTTGDDTTGDDTSGTDDASESVTESATESETGESAAESEGDTDTDADTDTEPTHGQVVSEFARTTQLRGCEKGQAISELASSKAADHRQNPERDHDPCDKAAKRSGDDDGSDDGDELVDVDAADNGGAPGKSGESHGRGHAKRGNAKGHAKHHDD